MPPSEARPPPPAASAETVQEPPASVNEPRVIPREEHGVSRKAIDANALKVLYRLHNAGFQAHLVGGGVRDLLLGLAPKDFDVATDATPEQVRELFRNCRLIGRRFRLAHIVFGRDVIEVATFRGSGADTAGIEANGGDAGFDPQAPGDGREDASGEDDQVVHDDGRILRDNVFGTLEDDAFRRDFTINALYYDISRFAVLDFTDAMADLAAKRLRLIGEPAVRYREDPVRMLRTARFAAKLDFDIHPATAEPIFELGALLREVPPSRLFDEVLKLFQNGHALKSLECLFRLDLLAYLFPAADAALKQHDDEFAALLECALINTDRRIAADKPVTPAFIYAVLLWPEVKHQAAAAEAQGEAAVPAVQQAAAYAADAQQGYTSLPKRFAGPMREIWILQTKLERYHGKRARRLLTHPRLRAGWDFLCLRRDAGEPLGELCDAWQHAMDRAAHEPEARAEPGGAATDAPAGKRRRRGGRRRRGAKT